MESIGNGGSIVVQLKNGAAVLAALATQNTQVIKARVEGFAKAQRNLEAAQAKVVAAMAQRKLAKGQLDELEIDLRHALEEVTRGLIAEKRALRNPFAQYSDLTPSRMMNLKGVARATAVHQLFAMLQRDKTLAKETLQTGQVADKAAAAVETALAERATLDATLAEAQHACQAIRKVWAVAFNELKDGARYAAGEGAPHLYASVYGRAARASSGSKKGKPSEATNAAGSASAVAEGSAAPNAEGV